MNTTKERKVINKLFWPIYPEEHKKFIPMALMMFFILLNYAVLRAIKDGFVVTLIGTEALGFIKLYLVLPSAVVMIIIYTKLCNLFSQDQVFYIISSFFLICIMIFGLVLYPNVDYFHMNKIGLLNLTLQYPHLKWFIKVAANWSYAFIYVISELWGSVMLSLLFWQFANRITSTEEAKRFYSMFGLIGNLSLPCSMLVLSFLKSRLNLFTQNLQYVPIFCLLGLNTLIIIFLYKKININIAKNKDLIPKEEKKKKAPKPKLTLKESFYMVTRSKYIGLMALLVMSYGISINLVEGVWKSRIKELYVTSADYTMFMGQFQAYQGIAAIIFMIIGSNILRNVTWKTAAILTPIVMICTGAVFFSLIIFDTTLGIFVGTILGISSLNLAIFIGTLQNVLSKATKYSLFDSTKEMAYIPLPDELKTKGKAAVDVLGGRLGKSGGGIIQSTFFVLFPSFSFKEASPFFASIFFVVVFFWIISINLINIEYQKKLSEQKNL